MAEVIRPVWMTNTQWKVWQNFYLEAGGTAVAGSADRATEQFRDDSRYGKWFPGITRDDGTIRYATDPEATYFSNIAAFKQTVENAGLNPKVFQEEYIDLIEGDVAPREFVTRVDALYSRVLDGGDLTRNWYAENLGIVPSNAAILAGLMSSRVNDAILNKDITMAEIGGQAAIRDLDISSQFSEMLQQQGMDRDTADKFFGSADRMLPVLGALAARHGDPDDDFSLEEYAQGEFFNDAAQSSRIDRLRAQELSTFTGGKDLEIRQSRATGGATGLDVL